MNKFVKYIGIIDAKFPLSSNLLKKGNIINHYKITFDERILNMKCRNFFDDMFGDIVIDTAGFIEKSGEKCWTKIIVDRKTSEIIKGKIVIENSDEILNEIIFLNTHEVNKTHHTWTDENKNNFGKYLHNFEKFNVPFLINVV